MNILHIGHSKGWRGGENQARLLIEMLTQEFSDIKNYIAYPCQSQIIERLSGVVSGALEFSSSKILNFRDLYHLIKFCRLHHIDILHAHSARAHSLAYFAKFFIPEIKVVVHRRVDNRIKKSYFTRKKYLSEKIDAFLAVSDKTYAMLESYGVVLNSIALVKDGIPLQRYNFPEKKSAKNNLIHGRNWLYEEPLVGFVSAMDHQKNPLLFVEMISRLRSDGVFCNAVMAGTGKEIKAVNDAIIARGLSGNIKLLGFVDNVQDVFQGIDIFVLPSRNEGLGTVLLEAALAECVIIASDVGGIGEVVKHQQTGLLAESESVESFVQAMKYILKNPMKTEETKSNAKQYVIENFNIEMVVAKTHDVYVNVMNLEGEN